MVKNFVRGLALSAALVLWVLAGLQGCAPMVPLPHVTSQEIQQEAVQIPSLTSEMAWVLMNLRYGMIVLEVNEEGHALAQKIVRQWKSADPVGTAKLARSVGDWPLEAQERLLEAVAIDTLSFQLTGHWPVEFAYFRPDAPPAGIDPTVIQGMQSPLQDQITRVGAKIAQAAGLNVSFVLDPRVEMEMNAASSTGTGNNVVYVSPSLVLLSRTDDELAGVLGHEVAHISLGHPQPTNARYVVPQLTGALAGGLLTAFFLKLNQRNAAVGIYPSEWQLRNQAAAIAAAQGLGYALGTAGVNISGYTRQQEMEADVLGVRFAQTAGSDPSRLADFLGLQAAYFRMRGREEDSSFLRDHPSSPERIATLRKIAPPSFRTAALSTSPPSGVSSPPSRPSRARRRVKGGYRYRLE